MSHLVIIDDVVNIVYGSTTHSISALTTYTFAGMTLNAAVPGRKIIVGLSWVNVGGGTINSVTVAGVAAVKQAGATMSTDTYRAELWVADVPTGTTGDVVVVISDSADYVRCTTWSMTGAASSTAHSTAVDQDGSDPQTGTLNVPANGAAVGLAQYNGAATWTWTNLTEDADADVGGRGCSAASAEFTTAQSGLVITADHNGGGALGISVYASWGP